MSNVEPKRVSKSRLPLAVVAIAAIGWIGFGAGAIWRDATRPVGLEAGRPSDRPTAPSASPLGAGVATSPAPLPSQPASNASPTPTAAATSPIAASGPTTLPATFVAPPLAAPLRQLDPNLRRVVPTSLAWLYRSSSAPPFVIAPAGTPFTDWRLSSPNQGAVRGYAGDVSVVPGNYLALHIAGSDQTVRLDIFRMGLADAHHVETVHDIAITQQPDARPDASTGLIEDRWPVTYELNVPSAWRPGVYLAKLTGNSGGQSYIIFVVRSPRPARLMVVLPVMTYQAYNDEGGADLYRWNGGSHARAYEVSFDRPYGSQFGAGQFFWLDFPLIVWLEDHGYDVGYVTDLDLARNPLLGEGIDTLVFAGHSEYWTGGLRDIVGSQADHGTNLVFFGANDAFWQVRLAPDRATTPDRTIVCYKDANLDPIARQSPSSATIGFSDASVGRPASGLMGTEYAGIVRGLAPLIVGPAISSFAPDLGLQPGDRLAGLVGGEVDGPAEVFTGGLLGETPVSVGSDETAAIAGTTLWVNPRGGRAFDAGTFGWAWGLDPRYAAAAPGFPANAFDQLTARILAWAGAQPDPRAVGAFNATESYEATAGNFVVRAAAIAETRRLAEQGQGVFVVEEEARGTSIWYQVERQFGTRPAALAQVGKLQAANVRAALETDRGISP
jgi:hypothetical protein